MTYEGEEPIEVNGYQVVAFKESGTWTIPEGVSNVDVLVVAGGGSGCGGVSGDFWGGGGGAGEVKLVKDYDISSLTSPITVTVGDGGSPVSSGGDSGNSGGNSVFDTVTSSGGQGSQKTVGGSSGSSNSGGSAGGGDGRSGGGGGGQSQSGSSWNGGDGVKDFTIDSTTYDFATLFGTANTGEEISGDYWYGGGGAGYDGDINQSGTPGKGGGAEAPRFSTAAEGTPNTGGGGMERTDDSVGGTGGSGIVIIAYEEILGSGFISSTATINGSLVEGATVRLINQSTNSYVGETVTNASGEYTFEGLSEDDFYHVFGEYKDVSDDTFRSFSFPYVKPEVDEE